jgi:hypothetical protein
VGQSLEERDRALDDLTSVLLIGGPATLVLASLWPATGPAARTSRRRSRRRSRRPSGSAGSRTTAAHPRRQPELRSAQPGELTRAAAERARRRPSTSGMRMAVGDLDGTPAVLAEPGRVAQALDNLLENALRYAAVLSAATPRRISPSRLNPSETRGAHACGLR